MITPAQHQAILDAVEEYLDEQRAEADKFIGAAFTHGREGIAELAGADIVQGELDAAKVETLVQANFDLIVSVADRWVSDVQDLVGEGYLAGESPVDIASRLSGYFGKMPGNWGVIARDQVAKAQLEGRNTTYGEIGSTQVEVTCAPDACDECTAYDELVVGLDDDDSRPQFHIQCACMDVPALETQDPSPQEDVDQANEKSDDADHSSNREDGEDA